MHRVREYIQDNRIFDNCRNVVVGLSGGADSVALIHILSDLKNDLELNLHAVHVNHGIRDNAMRDVQFSEKVCKELNIPITVCEINCISIAKENGISVEEAGRNERYRLFNQVGQEIFKDDYVIAIAHHGDDVAETVLFNLARGTGINGLASIKAVNNNVVRPLLCVDREDILKYLDTNGINHIEDETNLSDDYSRNRIRHKILPELNIVTNGASKHIVQTAVQLGEIEDYLSQETENNIVKYVQKTDRGWIIKNELKTIHPAIVKRVIHKVLTMTAGKARDISTVQIQTVEDLFNHQVGKRRNLIYGMIASREYDGVELSIEGVNVSNNANIELSKISIEVVDRDYSQIIPNDLYTKWIDYDKITCCPTIRFRQKEDYIIINDNNDKKMLSDYMKNEKIPANKRDLIPLVADGNHILWVVGYRISAAAKVSDNTSRLLVLKYMDKER